MVSRKFWLSKVFVKNLIYCDNNLSFSKNNLSVDPLRMSNDSRR